MSSCSSMCNQSSSPLILVSSKEKPAVFERNFEMSEVPARQTTKALELICLDYFFLSLFHELFDSLGLRFLGLVEMKSNEQMSKFTAQKPVRGFSFLIYFGL